jgi:hypothetical protein
MHIRVDHAEPESKFWVKQVQWVFEGPQSLSCEDANIIVIKASPSAFNPILEFFFFVSYLWILLVH